jgi:hypothetical protein
MGRIRKVKEQCVAHNISIPRQVPHHFRISQLPSAVNSFLISLFQESPETQQPAQSPSKRHKLIGTDVSSIPNPSDLQTHSYRTYQLAKNTESLAALSRRSEREGSPHLHEPSPLSPVLCAPPWMALVRPLRHMTCRTQDLMRRIKPASFYSGSTKDTHMKTLGKDSNKRSQGQS